MAQNRTPPAATMSSLRILHLLDRLDRYGPARWIDELIRHTPPSAAVHEVVAYRSRGAEAVAMEPGVVCRRLSGRWSWDPVALGRLAAELRRPWDVIHLWDESSRRRQRLVGRRATPRVYVATAAASARSVRRRSSLRVLASHADDVQALIRRGFAADQIDLVPLGVAPPAPATEAREATLERIGWPPATRLIATAGPLTRASRFDDAAWAYELVRLLHPDARLAIVGRGHDEHRLRRVIRLVSDPQSVRILDEDEQGQAVLSLADVYWETNVGRFVSYELLGAMARGRCVVATDTPAHRRVMTHEQTGYLVDPDSRTALAYWTDRALSDRTLNERVGQAAADHVRTRFDPGAAAALQCEIYRHACGR